MCLEEIMAKNITEISLGTRLLNLEEPTETGSRVLFFYSVLNKINLC